jgi:hypothetical protein
MDSMIFVDILGNTDFDLEELKESLIQNLSGLYILKVML